METYPEERYVHLGRYEITEILLWYRLIGHAYVALWSWYTSHVKISTIRRASKLEASSQDRKESDTYCHSWNQRTEISTLQ